MKEKQIRSNYKFFKKHKKTVYFDNSASSLKPNFVVKAVNNYNAFVATNAGRAVYKLGHLATKQIEDTRLAVANLINAKQEEIVFTKNATESLNLAVFGYCLNNLKAGDEIVVSLLEHHSLYLPLLEASKITGAKLIFVNLDKDHKITIANFKKALTNKTKVVALTHISNATGAKLDVKPLIKLAKKVGATSILDSAQAVSHIKIDVKELDCDFLAFSGYKLGAPTGVGVLYGKYSLLQQTKPLMFGGGMVLDSTSEEVEYKKAPEKFEAGTQPVGQIIGLGKAISFLTEVGYDYIQKKDAELYNYLYNTLSQIKEVEIYNKNADVATIIFNLKGVHAHDAATAYDMYNICVRAGHNCVQPFVEYLGQVSILRASLNFYNTKKEVDRFIQATKKIIAYFKKF
jgi:cysteine desulfurase / selenocysteine lyase